MLNLTPHTPGQGPEGPGAGRDKDGGKAGGASAGANATASASATPGSAGWAAWLLIGLAIAAVVLLAVVTTTTAGNDTSTQAASSPVAATGDVVEVDVTVEGMSFVPNSVDVPAGSALRVNFTNTGDQVHDLKIGEAETGRINPGDSAVLDAGVIGQSIEGYCTIAGHRTQGMTFMVNVTGAAPGAGAGGGEQNAGAGAGAGAENPYVKVPTAAELEKDPGPDFQAFDPKLQPAPAATTHEYEWVITEETREVAPGVEQTRWLFNGQAPGPTLRGKVGDKFKITLRNEGSMGHSVDFHAGEVSPDAPMSTIQPGEEIVYEFTAKRSGIWMYHCATAPMSLHIANGMAGAVIIDPPTDSDLALDDVDAEYGLIASEIFLGDGATGADAQRVTDGDFDLTAFNYYPDQYVHRPIKAKVGDKIRIWVLNVGPDQPLSFHVVGEVFDTVFTEGRFTIHNATDTGAQAVSVLPAQGAYVEMTFDEPGTYTFVNHIMTSSEKGQKGQIVVTE